MSNHDTYNQWSMRKQAKLVGLTNNEKRARYQQYVASRRGADVQSHARVQANQIVSRQIRPGKQRKSSKDGNAQRDAIFQTMVDPWSSSPFRIPVAGISPKTILYSSKAKGNVSFTGTTGNVQFIVARAVGALTSAPVNQTVIADTTTAYNVEHVGGDVGTRVTVPDTARLLVNRPTAACMKLLYEGDISTATGEITFGTIPREQGAQTFTYEELIEYTTVTTMSIQKAVRSEILVPWSPQDTNGLEFRTKNTQSTSYNMPIIALTGIQPITLKICYLEYGECFAEVNDPLSGAATRFTGKHAERDYAWAAEKVADAHDNAFFESYSDNNNPNWVKNALIEGASGLANHFVPGSGQLVKSLGNLL